MSVRWRLTLILLLTMLPAMAFSLREAWTARESEIERVQANTHRLALVAAAYQRELLDGTRRVLTTLSQIPEIRSGVAEDCSETLARLLTTFPEYRNLATTDENGEILCSGTEDPARGGIGDRDWFREARETQSFTIGRYVISGRFGAPVLPAALPMVEDGRFSGVIFASISINWLERLIRRISLPEFGMVHLLDRGGNLLAVYPAMADPARFLPEASQLEQILGAGTMPPVVAAEDQSGARRLYGLAEIEGGDALVLFGVPHRRALSGVAEQFRSLLVGPLAMWALAIVAAWLSSEFLIARWIRRLSRTAAAFSRGDLSVRPQIPKSPTELRQLAETFAAMADTLQAREADLRGSLEEKEVLLKEIHHRVNNNLQTVTSLLNLQSRRVVDPAARRALDTTQMRVRALALVHKHLYEGENLAAVDMKAFIADLCAHLWRIHGVDEARVRPVVEMPPLHVRPDTAIPLGLLITEAVANALKHAFPDDRAGQVLIALEQKGATATLRIADTGVGRPPTAGEATEDEKLGLTLIRALALQLRARLTLGGPPGTAVILEFNRPLDIGTRVRRSGAGKTAS